MNTLLNVSIKRSYNLLKLKRWDILIRSLQKVDEQDTIFELGEKANYRATVAEKEI